MIINPHWFAFPVNALAGLVIIFVGWRAKKLSSITHIVIALALVLAVCLVQGFMPAGYPFIRTWPFVVALVWLLVVLTSALFRKPSLTYFGLWLALFAGVLGAADSYNGQLLVHKDGFSGVPLPFELRLTEFTVDTYPGGEPMDYRAGIELSDKNRTVNKTLRVNHPVSFKGHQLYLSDYGKDRGDGIPYCILMYTRQPWRWLVLSGILLMMAAALKSFFK